MHNWWACMHGAINRFAYVMADTRKVLQGIGLCLVHRIDYVVIPARAFD
jgi:hypothetical protein